jgi:tetratricopeptide (TPR) repeat protein
MAGHCSHGVTLVVEHSSPNPDDELAIAEAVFAKGEHKHAANHLASVLVFDPHRADALALLNQLIAAVADPLELAPLEKETYVGTGAMRAYILARIGKIADAVDVLLQVVTARPDISFLDWAIDWLDRSEARNVLHMNQVNSFLGGLLQRYPGTVLERKEDRDALAEILPFIEKVSQTQVVDGMFRFAFSALLRKVGRLDEALAVAHQGFAATPTYHLAVAIGMAHEAKGDMEKWYEAYQKALQLDPENVPARLDLADKVWNLGKIDEAERWYQEALVREPEHPWALPSLYGLRFFKEGNNQWRDRLEELVAKQPGNERARQLARQVSAFVGYLPDPADATIDLARKLIQAIEGNQIDRRAGSVKVTLSCLESPSSRLAVELAMIDLGADVKVEYTIQQIQTPDPRQPRVAVDYQIWKHKGIESVAAWKAPSPEVAWEVSEIASTDYDLFRWSALAKNAARKLGGARLDDLLGVMVHPPRRVSQPAQTSMTAWGWLQRIQIAAAMMISQLDGTWANSARRKALFSLANGPMDWTVTAAIVALTALALNDPKIEEEVIELFRALMHALPNPGYVPYTYALVCCYLQLPNRSENDRDVLRGWRQGLEQGG